MVPAEMLYSDKYPAIMQDRQASNPSVQYDTCTNRT